MNRDALAARHAAFLRGRTLAAVLAVAPVLALYLLLHTPWLRSWLPANRELAVLLLIGLPGGWLFGVMRLYRRLAPGLMGLRCPGCGLAWVDEAATAALETGRCGGCGAALTRQGAEPPTTPSDARPGAHPDGR